MNDPPFGDPDTDTYPVDSITPDVRDLPDDYWERPVHEITTGGKL